MYQDQEAFPAPALVLLDLKMPRVDGFELLQWKSSRLELSNTPFVVLSSSDLECDKKRAADLGAQDYLTKPMGLDRLVEMIENLERFLR